MTDALMIGWGKFGAAAALAFGAMGSALGAGAAGPAAIGAWKDYLWPSLVLTNPSMRPISVALPIIERSTDLATFFAVLVVASIVPIVLFLIFQKPLLASAGATAGLKD